MFPGLGSASEAAVEPPAGDAPAALLAELGEIPFWWHSIDLGHGVITPGLRTPEQLEAELEGLMLPPLAGRSVLDIGAWDGFFAFAAERRGAARVVALDHFVWCWDRSRGDGDPPRTTAGRRVAQDENPLIWDPVGLPGKRPFDLAARVLSSRVETVVADFMNVDTAALGAFDIVLFLGVLYHLQDPLRALRRLAALTRATAVIETEARVYPGFEQTPLCEFFAGQRLFDDPTNWWAPNEPALILMLREAGFERVEVTVGPPPLAPDAHEPLRYRTIVQAHKPSA